MIVSYVAVLFIPLAAAFVGFQIINASLTDNTFKMSRYGLEQFALSFEENLDKGEQLIGSLTSERLIQDFSQADTWYEGMGTLENINYIKSKMSFFDNVGSFMSKILLYFPKSDVAFLNSQVFLGTERLYGFHMNFGDLDETEWESMIQTNKNMPEYSVWDMIFLNKSSLAEADRMLVYIKDIYKSGDYSGKAFGFIPYETIDGLAANMDLSGGGYLTVEDKDGNLIYVSEGFHLESYQATGGDKIMESTLRESADGSRWVISGLKSDTTGWIYHSVLPANAIFRRVDLIRNMVIASLIFTAVAVVILALLLSYRKYKPIRRLSKMLDEQGNVDFTEMQTSLTRLLSHNRNMETVIDENEKWIRNSLYRMLIHTEAYNEQEIEERLVQTGVLKAGLYFMICIYLVSDRETGDSVSKEPQIEAYNIRMILSRFLNDKFGHSPCYLEYGSQKGIVLFDSLDGEEQAEQAAAAIQAYIREKYGFRCFCSAGKTINTKELNRCYAHCECALRRAVLQSEEKVVWYRKDMKEDDRYFFPLDSIQKSVTMLLQGDVDGLSGIYEELYRNHFEQQRLPGLMPGYFLSDLKSNSLKIIYEAAERIDLNLELYGDRLWEFETCREEEKAFQLIRELTESLCADILAVRIHNKTAVFSEAVEYVDQNYADPQLSLSLIAGKFQFTVPYFSVMFKKCTGFNFTNYLENKRIEYAVSLLKTDKKIKEIAELCGYNSELTFRNAFKRVTGRTPGEYRRETAERQKEGNGSGME